MELTHSLQITQTEFVADSRVLDDLSCEFAETGCAMLPGFLSSAVLKLLLQSIETTRFVPKNEEEDGNIFGTTLFVPAGEPSLFFLHFVLNNPAIFKAVEGITQCPPLTEFVGRIHRTGAVEGHAIEWHDDALEMRTVGISINLGTTGYSGGAFELRGPDRVVRRRIAEWSGGDAFLFRIGAGWQHRIIPVACGFRTVGVGWFRTVGDWRSYALGGWRQTAALEAGATGQCELSHPPAK